MHGRLFLAGTRSGALLVGALLAPSPVVAATPHTRVEQDGTAVSLILYEAACDDNPRECLIADLGCPSRGEFKASVYALKAREAGLWLASDAKAYLAVGATRIALRTLRIENDDMNGDWYVQLSQAEDAGEIWRAVARPGALSLTVAGRTVAFPRTTATLDAFRALLQGCAPP